MVVVGAIPSLPFAVVTSMVEDGLGVVVEKLVVWQGLPSLEFAVIDATILKSLKRVYFIFQSELV